MSIISLVVHDIRSTHNVGSLFRTAEGLGINNIYLTGYTPYPLSPNDNRLPHISSKLDRQIHKTALGAEKLIKWQHTTDIFQLITSLRRAGYQIVALEQAANSKSLFKFKPANKLAILIGNEVKGLDPSILLKVDTILEIPMQGDKESFNVVQASAMALYHIRFLVNH